MASNLFAKAKSVSTSKDIKSNQKTTLSIKDNDFFEKVQILENLQDNIKRDTAKADMLSDELKDISKSKWVELYEKTGRNPGSVVINSKKGTDLASLLFVPADKYITIKSDRAETLIDKYGSDIVEEKTTFSFDNEMIEKWGEVISRMIEESNDIDEDDKGKIIKAVSTFSIAKGTIDKMKSFDCPVTEIMEEVRPVISLKNVEVIKG